MTYASKTEVPVERSRNEIQSTFERYGADRFAFFVESGRAIIVFEANSRRLKFELPLPAKPDHSTEKTTRLFEQTKRSRWRGLLLCIKAKLESVESGIETFEEAFLAHVVMPDGKTVGQHTAPMIASSYEQNRMVPLLPGPTA